MYQLPAACLTFAIRQGDEWCHCWRAESRARLLGITSRVSFELTDVPSRIHKQILDTESKGGHSVQEDDYVYTVQQSDVQTDRNNSENHGEPDL
jgi:hypothetical protein